jgi:PAS domain S-box-containing protein
MNGGKMWRSELANIAGSTILVVDDSPFHRELLNHLLSNQRYRVLLAENAAAALAVLAHQHPDLILLDVMMPDMDGYQLCQLIGEQPRTADIPVIFISANDGREERVRAFASGGVDYICKPIESEEVLARIATHLSLQTLRRDLEQRVQKRTAELEAANRNLQVEIAERRQAEEQLRQRNALINCLVDANIVGIMFLRRNGTLIDANTAFLDLFGLNRHEVEAGQVNWHTLVAPENTKSTLQAVAAISRYGRCLPYEKICLHRQGHRLHVLIGSAAQPDDPDRTISFVVDISELKRVEQQLRESRQHLRNLAAYGDAAMEQERKRIAREIHDEQGSLLTALKIDLTLLRRELSDIPPAADLRLDSMQKLLDETVRVMRQVSSQLRPAALNLGLLPSLEWLATDFHRRTGVPCRCEVACEVSLDDSRATALFRSVQESLTNITRHAAAQQVEIALENAEDELNLRISDDGVGFDPQQVGSNSFGLRGISERLEILGGRLDILSAPGRGTTLHIAIPLANKVST